MSTAWEGVLADLERHVAEVLAAVHGDVESLAALETSPRSWTPPTVEVIPSHLVARAQQLADAFDRAQALLTERLRSLEPQRAVARRLDTSVRRSAYLDVRA